MYPPPQNQKKGYRAVALGTEADVVLGIELRKQARPWPLPVDYLINWWEVENEINWTRLRRIPFGNWGGLWFSTDMIKEFPKTEYPFQQAVMRQRDFSQIRIEDVGRRYLRTLKE